ncbi:8-oxoguanine DNA glycosylase [Verrucomicrobiota bacterium]|nr:8-oxoguanine DNA glycosylase [Verrucomicrobiota bacterium]
MPPTPSPTLADFLLPVTNYALAETLASGQAFRWRELDGAWEGVVAGRWVRLRADAAGIRVTTAPERGRPARENTASLTHYLQTHIDLAAILATFPDDEPMRAAVAACPGLRLLRQDPWECLASFILSSTKQIVQIQQIVALLCERFGEPLAVPAGHAPVFNFPSAQQLAARDEAALRACKMGFRAPYLLGTARMVSDGTVDLARLATLPVAAARDELLRFPGVGRKIADCVLLFAYGFQDAFPVDVWVRKALQQLYFPRRRASAKRIEKFAATHFGPNAGYAQQYLFHYMRTRVGRAGA